MTSFDGKKDKEGLFNSMIFFQDERSKRITEQLSASFLNKCLLDPLPKLTFCLTQRPEAIVLLSRPRKHIEIVSLQFCLLHER